jgi:hypothetical protein
MIPIILSYSLRSAAGADTIPAVNGMVVTRDAGISGDASSRIGRARRSCGSRPSAYLLRLSHLALHPCHGEGSPMMECSRPIGSTTSINRGRMVRRGVPLERHDLYFKHVAPEPRS